ncbi:RodZ domain-containing protein [Microbulbifer sp. 2304DJ12-6]|uniref:RodZ domain-containing protein n=1 Tax=Microbulbifer sp. 2304DJ12-6 TaxID=3233340 RepID=UPI0039AF135F
MTDSSSMHCDSADAMPSAQKSPISPGNLLRTAREAAGLSRRELSQRLCIIDNAVEYLEDDIYQRQPEMVYARGYIRNICRELSIPSEPVLAAYEACRPQPEVRTEARHLEMTHALRPARRRPQGLLALLPLLAAAGIFWWLYGGPVSIPQVRVMASLTEGQGVASPSGEVAQTEAVEGSVRATPQTEPVQAGGVGDHGDTAVVSGSPILQTDLPQAEESALALSSELAALDRSLQGPLRLRFDEDAWIEVKDAGGVVLLAGVQEGGTSKSLDGRAPFELMLGNARATHVVYLEKTVDSEPIGNRRTRRLIVGN